MLDNPKINKYICIFQCQTNLHFSLFFLCNVLAKRFLSEPKNFSIKTQWEEKNNVLDFLGGLSNTKFNHSRLLTPTRFSLPSNKSFKIISSTPY